MGAERCLESQSVVLVVEEVVVALRVGAQFRVVSFWA
jgi:hypothetical protein